MSQNQQSHMDASFSLTVTQEGNILKAKFHHNSQVTLLESEPLYGKDHEVNAWAFSAGLSTLFLQRCFPEALPTGTMEINLDEELNDP